MNLFIKITAIIGLLLTLFPAFFVFSGSITLSTYYNIMFIGMVVWFLSAPFWKGKKSKS
jgi:hypothetical protein